MLVSRGLTIFSEIVSKCNAALIGRVSYYREAVIHTNVPLDALFKAEDETHVKIGLNSKMPLHFPPFMFYILEKLVHLKMLSMGHVLILQSDFREAKKTDVNLDHYLQP